MRVGNKERKNGWRKKGGQCLPLTNITQPMFNLTLKKASKDIRIETNIKVQKKKKISH